MEEETKKVEAEETKVPSDPRLEALIGEVVELREQIATLLTRPQTTPQETKQEDSFGDYLEQAGLTRL